MDTRKIVCPNCQKKLAVSERHYGQSIECPSCQQQIDVPANEWSVLPDNLTAEETSRTSLTVHTTSEPPEETVSSTLRTAPISVLIAVTLGLIAIQCIYATRRSQVNSAWLADSDKY